MRAGHGLTRQYHTLTGDERFKLVVEARARADHTEADRLIDSCPRGVYEMNEQTFVRRALGTRAVVEAFVLDVSRYLSWIEALTILSGPIEDVCDLVGESLAMLNERVEADQLADDADEEACDEGDGSPGDQLVNPNPTPVEGDDTQRTEVNAGEPDYPLGVMRQVHRFAVAGLALRWDAFSAVCLSEIGLDAETVLRAKWPGMLERLAPYRTAMHTTPLRERPGYPEGRQETETLLRDIWHISGLGLMS